MRTHPIGVLLLLVLAKAAVADGPGITVAPVSPPAFRLLAEPAVLKELALTGAQHAAFDRIRRNWIIPADGLKLGVAYIPADVFREGISQQANGFLTKELTEEQRTRLDQIGFQLREREFGPHQVFAMAAREIGLRPDQLDDVRTLKGLRVEEIAKAVTSGKRYEKVKADVSATNGETFEKMAEMLTRAQRKRLKELRGRPFDGKVSLELGTSNTPPRPEERWFLRPAPPAKETPESRPVKAPAAASPTSTPGLYDLELKYLDSYAIGKELKLTNKQSGDVARAWLDFPGGKPSGRIPAGMEAAAHEYTSKILSDVLTAAQRARFDEIVMQRRERISPAAACTYPPTVSALKLTPIQLQQLSGRKRLAEVLSKEQLTKYTKLLGEPFELPLVFDEYLPMGVLDAPVPARGPAAITLSSPYVQARDFLFLTDRLQLSAEQVKKLRDLAEDEPKVRELIQKELSLDDTPPVAGAGRALTAVSAVTQMYREAVEKQCWDVLDPQQRSAAKKIFGRSGK